MATSARISTGISQSIKDRVQKLLNQAADQEGTPEAEAFYEKAFELMARHGLEHWDLPGEDQSRGMKKLVIDLTGKYTEMQMQLLNSIADGLHCTAVAMRRPRAVGVESGTVFGVGVHVERVELLFSILNPVMAALSVDVGQTPWGSASPVAQRRSFMQGFAGEIHRRLREAEERVGETDKGYALALIDDTERARKFMHEEMNKLGEGLSNHRRRGKFDPSAFQRGAAAARNADLGQRRMSGVRGLPPAAV